MVSDSTRLWSSSGSPSEYDDLHDAAVYVISVAAELAGMHPQTLRQYDRLGLVTPLRTPGRGRRYSRRDVEMLREIQRLSQEEGINLAGISRIIALEQRVRRLQEENDELRHTIEKLYERRNRVFAADASGAVQALRRGDRPSREENPGGGALVHLRNSRSLIVWRPRH
ncbi:MAG: helix-turn-helix transcriptional regulator [Actinomycetaceae bacterium]|nr:helix-turn-helix transcriptional regulator [Actinomycetaceae bacterium]